MRARLLTLPVLALPLLTACVATDAAGPAAVFETYATAANAGNLDAVRAIVDPGIARPPMSRCAPTLGNYDCMIDYIDETVIKRHSRLTTRAMTVQGDVVLAQVELANDATRAAGVQRIAGTDRLRVHNGKIVEFAFLRDEHDAQTTQFFDFMRRSAPRP